MGRLTKLALLPLLFYLVCFAALTFPLLIRFSTHLYGDDCDGLQTAWGVWWVDYAVTHLHRSPFWTNYLEFPHGVSALVINMRPFDGLVAIPLMRFLSTSQASNVMVVLGFVVGGLNAFLLAREVSGSYPGGIVAGFAFTFCNYHFTHAEGHLELVALEWLPLFALLWWRFTTAPSVKRGVAAASVLLLVVLCDYYYFFFCIVLGILLVIAQCGRARDPWFFFRRGRRGASAAFVIAALIATGPIVLSLLWLNHTDPFAGAHSSEEFSLDLLALFIPGGHWRFAALTEPYWSRITGGVNESSVPIGLSGVLAMVYVWRHRSALVGFAVRRWYAVFGAFVILALGPVLHIFGKVVPWLKLPYALLAIVVPPLQLSGCPVRMIIMAQLGVSIIWAFAVRLLLNQPGGRRWLAALLGLLVFEYLPAPIPTTLVQIPPVYETLLREQGPGPVADVVTSPPLQMWLQTIHHRPLAFGYLSRTPRSVEQRDARIVDAIDNGRTAELRCKYGFRFLIRRPHPADGARGRLYVDEDAALYDLGTQRCPEVGGPRPP